MIEGVSKISRLTNGCFTTISSHFFGYPHNILHKTEIQMIILRCWTAVNLNRFKSYDRNEKHTKTQNPPKSPKTLHNFYFFYKIAQKRKYLSFVLSPLSQFWRKIIVSNHFFTFVSNNFFSSETLIFHLFCPWKYEKITFKSRILKQIEEIFPYCFDCPKLQIHFIQLALCISDWNLLISSTIYGYNWTKETSSLCSC